MRLKKLNNIIFVIPVLFLLFSCEKEKRMDMTPNEKILFDSLYKVEFNDIRKKTDSICLAIQDSIYNAYVDSLLNIQLAEIEHLILDK